CRQDGSGCEPKHCSAACSSEYDQEPCHAGLTIILSTPSSTSTRVSSCRNWNASAGDFFPHIFQGRGTLSRSGDLMDCGVSERAKMPSFIPMPTSSLSPLVRRGGPMAVPTKLQWARRRHDLSLEGPPPLTTCTFAECQWLC